MDSSPLELCQPGTNAGHADGDRCRKGHDHGLLADACAQVFSLDHSIEVIVERFCAGNADGKPNRSTCDSPKDCFYD